VAKISPLPDAQTQWLNPDLKVYDTEIHLAGDLDGLRTGMTCRAEVLVEQYDDALYVPVHCVVRIGDQPTVYVVEEGRLVRRAVEVGLDNNRMVRVLSGLSEGELVALAPPLDEAEARPEGARPPQAESPDEPGPAAGSPESDGAADGASKRG
jgi:HlyD family secretion protein